MRTTKFIYRYFDKWDKQFVDKVEVLTAKDISELVDVVDDYREFLRGIYGPNLLDWHCDFKQVDR